MASDVDATHDFVVLASFENRHAAEHMLASLGRGFRKKHRKGHATALVISDNKDGSLELTLVSGPVGQRFCVNAAPCFPCVDGRVPRTTLDTPRRQRCRRPQQPARLGAGRRRRALLIEVSRLGQRVRMSLEGLAGR